MKQATSWKPELRTVNRWLLFANALALLISCSGGGSAPGVGIQGVTESAPRLSEFNASGDYAPYYATGDMQRPRYFFEYILNKKGQPMIFGGSDERGYSGLDTVEIFDQAQFDKDVPRPASLTGLWIDTNFEGDPITFENGPRVLFTLNLLADGRVLVVGGGSDLLRSKLYEQVEIFDPETRKFETLDNKMVQPRFRHTSVQLNDGSILFIGGQIAATVTIIDDRIPEGFPGRERQETRFLTTPLSEVFLPKENEFQQLNFPDSERPSKLNTPRGRANHATERLAGGDGVLGNSDDVLLVAAGFQSFTGQFSPDNKFPYNVARQRATGLTLLEFYDPITRSFTQVGSVSLDFPRMNNPYILNLGQFNDVTIDGVKGLGNMVLITHGNSDETCPVTPLTNILLVATYTGFGPAGGIQFFQVVDDVNDSHIEGNEYPLQAVGRCAINPIAMPRGLRTVPGAGNTETWFFTTAGVNIFVSLAGCIFNYSSPMMLSGSVFDPFFSRPAAELGLSPRDLRSQRNNSNPFGVIGCWLTMDGAIPTTDINSNFGTTPITRWARRKATNRVWGKLIPLAGEDGIIYSTDDRVLLAGGGQDYGDNLNVGGEPTAPSCEIVILPGSNSKQPSP